MAKAAIVEHLYVWAAGALTCVKRRKADIRIDRPRSHFLIVGGRKISCRSFQLCGRSHC